VRALARDMGRVLAERHPDELTTEFRKAERGGRILVDTARNGYAQTAVPPYGVRARPGAPVATPIEWDELSDSRLRPDRWTVKNVLRRLAAKGDPWAEIASYARGIARAQRQVDSLLS
jgi:bifunctional non-homologous end joining protein LigD